MPRLFTGLEIPEDIAFELNLMQGGVWGARWIEPADYHITLRFIGDIEERLANEIGYSAGTRGERAVHHQAQGCRSLRRQRAALDLRQGGESRPELRRLQSSPRKTVPDPGAGGRRAQVHAACDARQAPGSRHRRSPGVHCAPEPVSQPAVRSRPVRAVFLAAVARRRALRRRPVLRPRGRCRAGGADARPSQR